MLSSVFATYILAFAGALAKPEQIRAVQDPIFHFYLQSYPKNASLAVMGPEASSELFNINGSSKWTEKKIVSLCMYEGYTFDKTTVQSTNTSLYLNVGSDSTSYKTLTFGTSASTSAWALEGDTIITAQGSSWGRQLNFLACKVDGNYWQVYLQTGSATPSGATCSNYQSLHLPCLC